jgi:hypothetical protein
MATYKQIWQYIRQTEGFAVETCWIADVKSAHGLTTRTATNRLDPCAESALRHFRML